MSNLTKVLEESLCYRTQTLRAHKLPGRNEKCLCGSGKKFKNCCLEKFEKGEYQKYYEQ